MIKRSIGKNITYEEVTYWILWLYHKSLADYSLCNILWRNFSANWLWWWHIQNFGFLLSWKSSCVMLRVIVLIAIHMSLKDHMIHKIQIDIWSNFGFDSFSFLTLFLFTFSKRKLEMIQKIFFLIYPKESMLY